jgi:hypothetical protein
MPRSNADELRVLSRRSKVASLLVRGESNHYEITRKLGMEESQRSTISRDIQAIKAEWRLSAVRDFDDAVGRELAKLDALEAEMWAAWERSKAMREVSRTQRHERPRRTKDKDGNPVTEVDSETRAELRKEYRDGNAKFAEVILAIIDRRCKLLGLDPDRQPDGTPPPGAKGKELTDDERERVYQRLLSRMAARHGPPAGEGGGHSDRPPLGGPGTADDPLWP